MRSYVIAAIIAGLLLPAAARADGYLRAEGKHIVDGDNRPVILRGMGLGGWMLQEGYMLQLGQLGQQHVIRRRITELVGEKRAAQFYRAWLDNHTTRADIDAMAKWGFNSVRLPMHFDLLTLPVEREPKAGADTWHEEGFARIDRLLEWSKANRIYLILDLHAAPGGQGNDLAIADRDPAKPSLWESAENQRKTIALWRKLAARYADEPWIGGYDIINEPNWSFDTPGKGNGCADEVNAPLRDLQKQITAAIREVDNNHLIVIEGNCWGNNYKGVLPPWDNNLVLSFHKYWNYNDAASIAPILALRDQHNVPVWLGESGENSNVWFRDAIKLVESEGIGWAWWPLKKIGFNQPLEIDANPGWKSMVAYLTDKGPKPDADEAYKALMRLANHDIRFENNIQHRDVIDSMFRQRHDDSTRPFASHRLKERAVTINAVDYDMGAAGLAYQDKVDANYHVATKSERALWNNGRTYRNDGVDIARDTDGQPYVNDFVSGEWMKYALKAKRGAIWAVSVRARSAGGGTVALDDQAVAIPASTKWTEIRLPHLAFAKGSHSLTLRVIDCKDCEISGLTFTPL